MSVSNRGLGQSSFEKLARLGTSSAWVPIPTSIDGNAKSFNDILPSYQQGVAWGE